MKKPRINTLIKALLPAVAAASMFLVVPASSHRLVASADQPLVNAQPSVFLPVGDYPMNSYGIDRGDFYVETDGPKLVVTNSGGTQTHRLQLEGGAFEWTMLGQGSNLPADPSGTYVNRLSLAGIDFAANPPVKWRPEDVAGLFVPNESWSWTLQSSNGGVTLHAEFQSLTPHTEYIRGIPAIVERIQANLTFSGNAVGNLQWRHFQKSGNAQSARDEFEGSVTAGTDTSSFNTAFVMGGLNPRA